MQITMQPAEHLTPAEIEQFLDAGTTLSFAGAGRKEIYGLVERTLRARQYPGLSKKDKGIVRRYLAKISGLSLSQITRLIARWRERGVIEPRASRRRRFPRRYTPDDIARLAAVDAAHEGLSGPAVRRILQREFEVYGKTDYQRLASISASHIYNLRRTRAYREHHVHHTKTRAAAVSIGERRKPDPRGRPGYLRVDTVHQGDTETSKGLYHINAVDTVTQWQVVGCCETISEAHLKPVLEAILHQFPFRVRGFHSDNGSEFLNYRVARLLDKMRVEEFTKSRAHRSTDNALVERQKRRGGAQAHRTRTYRRRACRKVPTFLHGRFQPLFELSPSLWIRDRGDGLERQAPPPLPARRLSHTLRKVAFTRRGGELFEARDHGCFSAATSPPDERYRVRLAHATTQKKTARRLPLATLSRCLEPRCAGPDRTVRDSTGREGEGEAQETFGIMPSACSASPSPLTPLPARTPPSSQKGVLHPT